MIFWEKHWKPAVFICEEVTESGSCQKSWGKDSCLPYFLCRTQGVVRLQKLRCEPKVLRGLEHCVRKLTWNWGGSQKTTACLRKSHWSTQRSTRPPNDYLILKGYAISVAWLTLDQDPDSVWSHMLNCRLLFCSKDNLKVTTSLLRNMTKNFYQKSHFSIFSVNVYITPHPLNSPFDKLYHPDVCFI